MNTTSKVQMVKTCVLCSPVAFSSAFCGKSGLDSSTLFWEDCFDTSIFSQVFFYSFKLASPIVLRIDDTVIGIKNQSFFDFASSYPPSLVIFHVMAHTDFQLLHLTVLMSSVSLYTICCLCAFLVLFYLCPTYTFCIQHRISSFYRELFVQSF